MKIGQNSIYALFARSPSIKKRAVNALKLKQKLCLANLCIFVVILLGSGKTAAFLIPMFERLKTHSAKVRHHNQRNLRKLNSHLEEQN